MTSEGRRALVLTGALAGGFDLLIHVPDGSYRIHAGTSLRLAQQQCAGYTRLSGRDAVVVPRENDA